MSKFQSFKNGLLKENPVFSLFLGICSTLAITTTEIMRLVWVLRSLLS